MVNRIGPLTAQKQSLLLVDGVTYNFRSFAIQRLLPRGGGSATHPPPHPTCDAVPTPLDVWTGRGLNLKHVFVLTSRPTHGDVVRSYIRDLTPAGSRQDRASRQRPLAHSSVGCDVIQEVRLLVELTMWCLL